MIDRRPHPKGCWVWSGYKNRQGYGYLRVGGIVERAHRISWIIHNGLITDGGVFVCHKCDNPSCVNPDHLWLGTPEDNVMDMISKGRNHKFKNEPHMCCEGHRDSKLTNNQVLEIRALYSLGGITQRNLASIFGVSGPMICKIVNRRRWKYLEAPPLA
jgi:hypothetical protein